MPRARDPAREKAREMWEASGRTLKLREIAETLRVPEKTISGWKAKDGWDKKNERSTPKKERSTPNDTPKRKRGAQPGHPPQGGAPRGNANNLVTGAYSKYYASVMTEEELAFMEDVSLQSAQRRTSLTQHLAIQRVRELRLLKDIDDIRNGAEQLTRRTVSQIVPSGTKAADGREITRVVKISQEQETRREMLLRFEDALTRIQAEIRRTEDSLRLLDEAEEGAHSGGSENNLFDAMVGNAEEDITTDDIPELEQAATAGDDVVESAEP